MRPGPDRATLPFHRRPPVRVALAALALLPSLACAQARDALPEEGRVVAGEAALVRQDRTLTIHQQTRRTVLEWRSFDIGADAAVRFVQPSSSSVALNRVLGGDPSRIAGRLSANGHVYLVNPAGVLFAPGARIDVGNLVASTLDIANGDFVAGGLPDPDSGGQWPPFTLSALPPVVLTGLLASAAPAAGDEDADADAGEAAAHGAQPPAGLLTLDAGADGHLRIGLEPAQVQALIDDGDLRQDGADLALSADAGTAMTANAVAGGDAPQARSAAVRDGRLLLVAAPRRSGAAPRLTPLPLPAPAPDVPPRSPPGP